VPLPSPEKRKQLAVYFAVWLTRGACDPARLSRSPARALTNAADPIVEDVWSDVRGQRVLGLVVRKKDGSNRKRRRGQ